MPTYSVDNTPCVIWNEPDPVPDSVYESIAKTFVDLSRFPLSVGTDGLRAWHLLYWEKTPMQTVNGQITNWGDCGQPNSANIPKGGLTALSDISRGVGAGVGVASGAVAAAGGAAAASAAGLGILNAIPIIGTIASLALLPFEIIFAHHAAAVAKEQSTNCGCWATFNQWLDAIDQAVQTQQVSPEQGITMVQQLYSQAVECVADVSAACTPGHMNAACDLKAGASGLVLLRQWMYMNLPQFNPALAPSPLAGLLGSSSGAGTGMGSGIVLLLILLAILFVASGE
jgi:hypothetical protein